LSLKLENYVGDINSNIMDTNQLIELVNEYLKQLQGLQKEQAERYILGFIQWLEQEEEPEELLDDYGNFNT
jgi:hypothetical protein